MSVLMGTVLVFVAALVGWKLDPPGPAPHHRPTVSATAGRFEPDRSTLQGRMSPERFPDYFAPYERFESANRPDVGWAVAASLPVRDGWSIEAGWSGSAVENESWDVIETPPGHPAFPGPLVNELFRRDTSLRFAHLGVRRSIRLGERLRLAARAGAGIARAETRDIEAYDFTVDGPRAYTAESDHPLLLLGAEVGVRALPGIEAVIDIREVIHECDGDGLCAGEDRLDHTIVSGGLRLEWPGSP